MNQNEIYELVEKQRNYFKNGNTNSVNNRIQYLKKLRNSILKYENDLYEALFLDLGKSKEEAYMCEIGLVLSELSYAIKNIKKFTRKQRKPTPLFQFVASSYTIACPYGNVLIMSPWNYPFLLSVDPLLEAVACGNTVILKTSEYAIHTSNVIKKIINEVFPSDYCEVIYGGYEENQILINTKFDYVFFTGSKHVGKLVYQTQAKYMTPVTLELGGKSPVIIDETANLKMAAKRIAWGKTINSGQTCVAPDHIYVHKNIHQQFVLLLINEMTKQKEDALNNPLYSKMINEKHFLRVVNLINQDKVVYGGKYDQDSLKIEPTILDNVNLDDLCMQEEIFGPVLPIIEYEDLNQVIQDINSNDVPLAFYIFSSNKRTIQYLQQHIPFGGGCVNDVVMHLATCNLGFGGFKDSGIGAYHGKVGFDTFSHQKSIIDKATWIDMPMRYKPENKIYNAIIKFFLK